MRIIILISSIILCLFCCTKKQPGLYTNTEYGFSIKFPVTWQIKENEKGTIVMAINPDNSGLKALNENINVVSEPVPDKTELEKYVSQAIGNMKKALPGLKESAKTKMSHRGIPAIKTIYIYGKGVLQIQAMSLSFIKNNKAFVITAIAEKEHFNNLLPLFEGAIATFKFKD